MDQSRSSGPLWLVSVGLAALATWICFDAMPGINWVIWTAAAAGALVIFTRMRRPDARLVEVLAATAVIASGSAAISDSPINNLAAVFLVIVMLAMAMLLTAGPWMRRITASFAITAPVVAAANAVVSAFGRASDATQTVRSPAARGALRGTAITLPVVIVFALLLSGADPTFALWRDTIRDLVADWDFVPRTIFFVAMLTLSLGALSYSALSSDATEPGQAEPRRWLGSTERLMLLGSVAALLWIFLAVQLSYLFGNLPQITGSGMTFAEYARRGFGELTVVASATTLLIIASERFGVRDGRHRITRFVTFAAIGAVVFLLFSAFNRVLLYEAAYGFTTSRLYAQAFMLIVGIGVVALTIEVVRELDPGRLFRRVGTGAVIVLLVLCYWNTDAWIARKNIDRLAVTGKLDARYLVRDLSLNAVPAIISELPRMQEPVRTELLQQLQRRYTKRDSLLARRWFEANLRRRSGERALKTLGLP
jgi:hypothetical protein